MIQKIKQRYPEAKIMLNRGFHLLDRVASQIDSVAIESLYHGWYQDKLRYATTPLSDQNELFKQIDRIQRLNKPIIIIDYLPPNQKDKAPALAAQIAQKGLIPWLTDKSLQEIYIKKSQGLSRNILVMFSDEKKLPIQYIPAALYVSPILEYMGYIPIYFNLDETQSFPTSDLKNNYTGIVLWLEKQDLKHVQLLKWIHKQIKNGVRVVFLNSFGVPTENKTLAQMGLFADSLQDTIATLTITKMDSKFVGYEVQPIKSPY